MQIYTFKIKSYNSFRLILAHAYLLIFFISAEEMDKMEYEPEVKDFVNSREWLQKNGLEAQNLTIPRAFSDCAFRHVNGIVDIKTKPEDESLQTNAVRNLPIVSL